MKCLVLFILAVVLITAEGKAVPDGDQQPSKSIADPIRKENIINLDAHIRKHLSEHVKKHLSAFNDTLIRHIQDKLSDTRPISDLIIDKFVKGKTEEIENLKNLQTKFPESTESTDFYDTPEFREQFDKLQIEFKEKIPDLYMELKNMPKPFSEILV